MLEIVIKQRLWLCKRDCFAHPYVSTNRPSRCGGSCDFFRFAIFLFQTRCSRGRIPSRPLSAFKPAPKLTVGNGGLSVRRHFDCCNSKTPKEERECLQRARNIRLSSPWWELLRPWCSAVTTPGLFTSHSRVTRSMITTTWHSSVDASFSSKSNSYHRKLWQGCW